MKQYEHWNLASKGRVLAPFPASALNVLIFVIYEAFFMTALDTTVEIFRNFQMKGALRSGYNVVYAPALVWFGKQLETRSIKDGKEERGGLIGWIRFWFRRTGIAYTLLYAIPAAALIYAQLDISSVTAEAIAGNVRGHLLSVDIEELLQTQQMDRKLVNFMETVKDKKYYKKRAVIDSRVVHNRVYEVDGNPMLGKPCRPGSTLINSTTFEVRYLDTKEEDQDDLGSESTVSSRKPPVVTTSKAFTTIRCNRTEGKFCLAYQVKGPNLLVVTGEQVQNNNGLNTTERHSKKFARIFLHRDWKKAEAETLIQLMLPIVNERHDDDPIVIIDAVWLLSLRKMEIGEGKVVPEECELVTVTALTLPTIVIFGVLLLANGILVFYLFVRWLLKRGRKRTLLDESGTTRGLLWIYANELRNEQTGYNTAPEESPKVCINKGSKERDHGRQELIDVRPAFRIRNHLEISKKQEQEHAAKARCGSNTRTI